MPPRPLYQTAWQSSVGLRRLGSVTVNERALEGHLAIDGPAWYYALAYV